MGVFGFFVSMIAGNEAQENKDFLELIIANDTAIAGSERSGSVVMKGGVDKYLKIDVTEYGAYDNEDRYRLNAVISRKLAVGVYTTETFSIRFDEEGKLLGGKLKECEGLEKDMPTKQAAAKFSEIYRMLEKKLGLGDAYYRA